MTSQWILYGTHSWPSGASRNTGVLFRIIAAWRGVQLTGSNDIEQRFLLSVTLECISSMCPILAIFELMRFRFQRWTRISVVWWWQLLGWIRVLWLAIWQFPWSRHPYLFPVTFHVILSFLPGLSSLKYDVSTSCCYLVSSIMRTRSSSSWLVLLVLPFLSLGRSWHACCMIPTGWTSSQSKRSSCNRHFASLSKSSCVTRKCLQPPGW